MAQNFKDKIFLSDLADSYSFGKWNAEKCKNFWNRTTFRYAYRPWQFCYDLGPNFGLFLWFLRFLFDLCVIFAVSLWSLCGLFASLCYHTMVNFSIGLVDIIKRKLINDFKIHFLANFARKVCFFLEALLQNIILTDAELIN